jgi:MFS family permease
VNVCIAHWLSHVYLLVLPLLFPDLRDVLSVDYLELGLAVTVFSCVSAATQAPIGFVVDRFGPKRVLIAGLLLGGLALVLLSLSVTYPHLLIAAAMLGLANSVYHPANYAILSASILDRVMGRAFAIHTFSGHLGNAMAPILVIFLTENFGTRGGILSVGLLGLAVALILILSPAAAGIGQGYKARSGENGATNLLLAPRLWILTGFFMLLSLSMVGISNFAIVAFENGYGIQVSTATIALSAYLGASAIGVLAGGLLADRTRWHGKIVAVCFGFNAVIIGTIAAISPHVAVLMALMGLAGFLSGLIAPSRDMLVRKSVPSGATGRAFGLVTTGFSIGGIVGPLIFGTVMDIQQPRWIFVLTALAMIMALVLSLIADRRSTELDEYRV